MAGLSLERLQGKYEIVAKIKEGGMGAIYKVRHRLLDEVRVVKVLRSQLEKDPDLNQRFAQEARAAIKLRHPNVVQIFDFLLEEGTGFIVMEYIRGIDLQELIRRHGPPSLALSLEIARQSLRALGYLHQQGFVHRDISPDNLMLCRDFEERPLVKMIDLGIAKDLQSDPHITTSGMFLGKFRYSSPEHFGATAEQGGIDERSDLYSFGVVLYEFLTGEYPIHGETNPQLIAGHLFQEPLDFTASDPEGRLPAPLREVVLKTLEKKPGRRFKTASELAAVIEALQTDFPVTAETLEEARALTEGDEHEEPVSGRSSTQSRLDRGFGLDTTPRPEELMPEPPSTWAGIPAADQEEQVAALLAGAETLLRLGHREQAGAQITAILRLSPDQPRALALRQALAAGADAGGAGAAVALEAPPPPEPPEDEPSPEQKAFDEHLAKGCELESAGDLAGAVAAFEEALAVRPDNEAVRQLLIEAREGLAQEQEGRQREIEKTLAKVERRIAEKDFAGAVDLLDHLREPAAGETTLIERIEAFDRELETIHRELQESLSSLAELIEKGKLVEADRALFQAEERFGPRESFHPLRERLQELHRRELERQVQKLLADADAEAAAERFAEAVELVRKAQLMAPAELAIDAEAAAREKAWEEAAKARERRQAEAKAEAAIVRLLEGGELEKARKRLETAEADFAGSATIAELRERHTEKVQERVNELIQAARGDFEAGQFEAAAVPLRKALELAPADDWLRDRLAQTETALAQQKALAEAVAGIESLIAGEELDRAHERLEEARSRWPESDDFESLGLQLEARRLAKVRGRVRALVTEAEDAFRAHDLAKARRLATEALALSPHDVKAGALIEKLDAGG